MHQIDKTLHSAVVLEAAIDALRSIRESTCHPALPQIVEDK